LKLRFDASPIVFDLSRKCDRWNRSRKARSRQIQPYRATPFAIHAVQMIASCTVASFIGAVFRYANWTFRGLAGRAEFSSSFLSCHARQAALLGFSSPFAGLFPRMGERSISGTSGPHVASHAARPPRFIFVGVTEHPSGKHLEKGDRPGTWFSSRRSTSGL